MDYLIKSEMRVLKLRVPRDYQFPLDRGKFVGQGGGLILENLFWRSHLGQTLQSCLLQQSEVADVARQAKTLPDIHLGFI